MSLSPFDSFQSRFVTYLLNFPRTCAGINSKYFRKIQQLRYYKKSTSCVEETALSDSILRQSCGYVIFASIVK